MTVLEVKVLMGDIWVLESAFGRELGLKWEDLLYTLSERKVNPFHVRVIWGLFVTAASVNTDNTTCPTEHNGKGR